MEEKKNVVFICNSETDGFNEGDGDLMQKIAETMESDTTHVVRIVMYNQDVPDDKKDYLKGGLNQAKVIPLEKKRLELKERKNYNIKTYQNQFLQTVNANEFQGMNKIVYIGSRLDWGFKPRGSIVVDEKTFGELGIDLQRYVFSFMDRKTLMKTALVSKGWDLLAKSSMNLIKLAKIEYKNRQYIINIEELVLKQSGALFDSTFIKQLKKNGVKVVVCCLEYQFFFRAKNSLRSGFEMLRQQLFLADSIHFLTKKDHEFFLSTMDNFLTKSTLLSPMNPDDMDFDTTENRQECKDALTLTKEEQNQFDFKNTEFGGQITNVDWLKAQKAKGFYAAGIYTVSPLKVTEVKSLVSRPKNIIQFGMIRAEKGIDESLVLAKSFKEIGFGNLYIVGRVRELPILRHLIMSCYDCVIIKKAKKSKPRNFVLKTAEVKDSELEITINSLKKEDHDSEQNLILIKTETSLYLVLENGKRRINLSETDNESLKTLYKKFIQSKSLKNEEVINVAKEALKLKKTYYPTLQENKFNDAIDYAFKKLTNKDNPYEALTDVAWYIQEQFGMDGFNLFADYVLKYCKDYKLKKLIDNVEIYFNLSEKELQKLALECRYAIKLDHKGMAENASSIVSCMGLFLPVFTVAGYLTSEEFLKGGKYEKTLIIPSEKMFTYYQDEQIKEIRPVIPTIEWILNMLKSENESLYEARLLCLHELFKNGVFRIDRLDKQLFDQFDQLTENIPKKNIL